MISVIEPPKVEGWETLSVYRLNWDQMWLAETLAEALKGAEELFGRSACDLMDELAPPEKLGQLARLIYRRERTDMEDAAVDAAVRCLNDGLKTPALIGVLNS